MAENDAGERSEQATPKRLKEAREKGQVARSRELTTALLLMTASISLYSFSTPMGLGFAEAAQKAFSPQRKHLFNSHTLIQALGELMAEVVFAVAPFFLLLFALAALSPKVSQISTA